MEITVESYSNVAYVNLKNRLLYTTINDAKVFYTAL